MPAVSLFSNFFLFSGLHLGNIISPRIISLISVILICSSYLLMIFLPNYFLFLLSMIIFGIGSGLGQLPIMKNCYKYFPKKFTLINGILYLGYGLTSTIFVPIGDYFIINPNFENPEKGFYSSKISENFSLFLKVLFLVSIILGIIGMSLTFQFDEDEKIREENYKKEEKENLGIENSSSEEYDKRDDLSKKIESNDLCDAFSSGKNGHLIFICFCGTCK